MPADLPQAQLCTGSVRHARTRPLSRAFEYGIYFVRLPLRSLSAQPLDVGLFGHNRFNLLSFYERDHGDGKQPLLAWIEALLAEQGVLDADGEIWLQAMPRVLGYQFNPVSFWFCHRADGALRAVLCDVRNTFGERHFYFLENGAAIVDGTVLHAKKLFHVSPFFSLDGGYSFRFLRCMRTHDGLQQERHLACIDYHDDDGLLLSASLSGTARPLGNRAVLRAFFAYPLLTFGVVVKIHSQALRLWLRRVPFFSKPALPEQDISR